MDYYNELGVEKNAAEEDIKLAYRRLAKKYHPDRNKSPDAEERIKKINEAYGVLGNKKKRVEYDRQRAPLFNNFGKTNNDLNGIFNGSGFTSKTPIQKKHNVKKTFESKSEITIQVNFEDAILGYKDKLISYTYKHECSVCSGHGGTFTNCPKCDGTGYVNKNDGFISINITCTPCNGTGKQKTDSCPACVDKGYVEKTEEMEVSIPEGLEQKTKLFAKGKGNYINGSRGDLYITVDILPDVMYRRQGNNIVVCHCVDVLDIMQENKILLKTLRGDFEIELDPDTIDKPVVKKGKGTKTLKGTSYGDLIIELKPTIPKLKDEQKKLVSSLRNNPLK